MSESAEQLQDFPEGVEIVIEGADQVASPASSPFIGDISSSEEGEQEDMDDDEDDSEESLECGQWVTFTPGSETQFLGNRSRVEKGGVESGEEGSLHIAIPGASEEEVASSPGLRRSRRVRHEKALEGRSVI